MINLSLFGAGRIGRVHASSLKGSSRVRIRNVYDPFPEPARELAGSNGARFCENLDEAVEDPSVNGLLIASPTETHLEMIRRGVRLGKAVFCEKPLAMNSGEARLCVEAVRDAGGICSVGFNRRYDPDFALLKRRIVEGDIGEVESVVLHSRDPEMSPLDYLRTSGGIFKDMSIHDFDMASHLLGELPVSLNAVGSRLIEPALEEFGDIDTAVVTMKTATGKICTVHNGRRSGFGYDQRAEVFGTKGMLRLDNKTRNGVFRGDATGITGELPEHFFLERYREAYRLEMENFADVIEGKAKPLADATDGLHSLLLAEAAEVSLKEGRTVSIDADAG